MKMQRISQGFNKLAPFYTTLTKLVFGNSIVRAQLHFLQHIEPGDHVLILGGGSGEFLKLLIEKHPKIVVDYIDISPKMLAFAKQKIRGSARVNFIEGTEQDIPQTLYSVVITNFYLDLFSDTTLVQVIQTIKKSLQTPASWFVTEFVHERWWQRCMLWMMYRFFRITTGIEATRLPDWRLLLSKAGLIHVNSEKFYGGFIESSVYRIE